MSNIFYCLVPHTVKVWGFVGIIKAYRPNDVPSYDVWSFTVDHYYVYDNPSDFEEEILDLDLDYFQIENSIDISYQDCFGKNGVNTFAKTKVYIFTTEYEMPHNDE